MMTKLSLSVCVCECVSVHGKIVKWPAGAKLQNSTVERNADNLHNKWYLIKALKTFVVIRYKRLNTITYTGVVMYTLYKVMPSHIAIHILHTHVEYLDMYNQSMRRGI